jgi:hypothetical protein
LAAIEMPMSVVAACRALASGCARSMARISPVSHSCQPGDDLRETITARTGAAVEFDGGHRYEAPAWEGTAGEVASPPADDGGHPGKAGRLAECRPFTVTTGEPMRRTVQRTELPTIHDVFTWTMRTPRRPGDIRLLLGVPELASQYAQAITRVAS